MWFKVITIYFYNDRVSSSCRLAHHWVYETSKILHRDISISNIMFRRTRSHRRPVSGVLCDWDLAYDENNPHPQKTKVLYAPRSPNKSEDIVIEKHTKEHVGPCYRTGTGPFMALDLLRVGTVPRHIYRHDLESFFFVLVWFCAVFDPEDSSFGHIKNWESADLVSIGHYKREFLEDVSVQTQVFRKSSPKYSELISTWIKRLKILFLRVNVLALQIALHKQMEGEGERGKGGSNAAEIHNLELARNTAVTYETFMKCLDIDVTKD